MKSTRRTFLKNSATTAAGIGLASVIPSSLASARKSPNEKIAVGLIGCKNHGFNMLKQFMKQSDVEVVALCDIDDEWLNKRKVEVKETTGDNPKTYKDFRKFLDHKGLDAVMIGVPDHWHCLMTVAACEAGKDVYVEKPMANSIEECNIMAKAARKYKRVVQVGQQQRSGKHWRDIMDFVKSEKLGQIRKVQVWGNFNYGVGRDKVTDSAVPEGVDFDMWLGPAPERTFNTARFHGSWRMFWDYGGGLMTDWGVHLIDMALWAMDVETMPESIVSFGGNYSHPNNYHETYDTQTVLYQMKDWILSWEHTAGTQSGPYNRPYGIAYKGNNGTLVADRDGWQVYPEWGDGKHKMEEVPKQEGRSYHEDHVRNFLDCVKSRNEPNCPVEIGRIVAMYAHAGNIAARTGSMLKWDERKNEFTGNAEANKFVVPEYRSPWELPKI